jgi:DNA-binding response OmpR family regulator
MAEKKILLLDDEPDFTELLQALLEFHDFEVTILNDPRALEKTLDGTTFDVIVTDLMMPEIDGFSVVRSVRSREVYKTTPLLVLSAKMLDETERKDLLQQEVHLVTKPFEPQGLVERIEELL